MAANNTNEFQIDGVPNDFFGSGTSQLAYAPPVEATQEFKVQTNTYDSQYGRTGGGVVSVSIKPGTNHLHGAVYEQLRRTGMIANLFVGNQSGAPRATNLMDQYGFEVDGPVVLPKVFNGKDRLFFMFVMERYRDKLGQPVQGTLPTALEGSGDFSQTVNASGKLYTIYDPLTVRLNPSFDPNKSVSLSNLQYIRTAFAGNVIPAARMNPVGLRILQDFPLGNQLGDPLTHTNNWYGGNVYEKNTFRNYIGRGDYIINSAWKVFGRVNHSNRINGRATANGWDSPTSGPKLTSAPQNGVVHAVGTLDPRTVLSLRAGFNRRNLIFLQYPQFDQMQFGLPANEIKQLQMPNLYPVVTFQNYLGTNNSESAFASPSDTYSVQANILKIVGSHSIKTGVEYRETHYAAWNVAGGAGNYSFTQSWTSSNPQVTDASSGNAIASLLLGNMAAATATLNARPYYSWHYPVVFFQDDWQVTRRLTLNMGLRWDYESPVVERYNRQNRGFDATAQSPIQVPGYTLKGGLLFAGANGQPSTGFSPQHGNWQPRFGLAYKVLNSKPLVFRGGVAKCYLPATDNGGTTGFSQVTTAQVATPGYLPFQTLSDPFPNGLVPIQGAASGLGTNLGHAIAFGDPNRKIPYIWEYSGGFQYELRPGLLLEAGYIGSQTHDLGVGRSLNVLTPTQLALGTPYLSQVVQNPFYGVFPLTTAIGAQPTIQQRGLLVPFPQFSTVNKNNFTAGSSWYNSLQVKLEKRFSKGVTVLASYVKSKTMDAVAYLNPQDAEPYRTLSTIVPQGGGPVEGDIAQRFAVSGVFEFPFGPRRKFLSHGMVAHLLGGWDLDFTGIIQSGPPMPYPAGYNIQGNPKLSSGQTLDHWFDTTKSIWVAQPADTLRVTPLVSPNIRRYAAPQFDGQLIRNFAIKERQTLQCKVTALNLTNSPIFDFPEYVAVVGSVWRGAEGPDQLAPVRGVGFPVPVLNRPKGAPS